MVNVLVHHKVSDFSRWKEVFDQHLGMRKECVSIAGVGEGRPLIDPLEGGAVVRPRPSDSHTSHL